MPFLRLFVEAAGGDQAAAFGEGFAPHLAVGEPVGFGIDSREPFEFVFGLGEPGDDAPAHHHQLSLSGVTTTAADRLDVTRRYVAIRRGSADIIPTTAHM